MSSSLFSACDTVINFVHSAISAVIITMKCILTNAPTCGVSVKMGYLTVSTLKDLPESVDNHNY